MKKTLLLTIAAFMLCFVCSCNGAYDETNISDVSEYKQIWNLPERRAGESCELFPKCVDGLEVIDFNCKHTTYHLVGTGWQVELIVKYNADSFSAEKERIKVLCEKSVVCGNTDYFDNPAYATVWNWNSCFEYAVVDDQKLTISYIYLQLADKEKLVIASDIIPNRYDMNMSGIEEYSLYE